MGIRRIVFTSMLSAVIVASTGGLAYACTEPALDLPERIGPGDAVRFTIANIDNGASYSISVGGTILDRGIDNDANAQGYTGSFTMPDLGNRSGAITPDFYVEHSSEEGEGTINPGSDTFEYAAPTSGSPNEKPAEETGENQAREQKRSPQEKPRNAGDDAAPASSRPAVTERVQASRSARASKATRQARAVDEVTSSEAARSGAEEVNLPLQMQAREPVAIAEPASQSKPRAVDRSLDPQRPWWIVGVVIAALGAFTLFRSRRVPPPATVLAVGEPDDREGIDEAA